ncbi:MAG: tail fiber protein [Bacteroidota bacterium]|nr:tail fiber protein [Bacteroidota bacterium]
MDTKLVLQNLIDSTWTTNGTQAISGAAERQSLNRLLSALYIPVGKTDDWYGPVSTIPFGWHLMDGSSFSITDYADLFAALGGYSSPYGLDATDPTKFKIPLVEAGRSTVQAGTTSLGTILNVGQKGGEEKHILTKSELPNIQLKIQHSQSGGSGTGAMGGSNPQFTGNILTEPIGGGEYHNNMHPFIAVNKIIKLW